MRNYMLPMYKVRQELFNLLEWAVISGHFKPAAVLNLRMDLADAHNFEMARS